jgi:hypothetical protein
MNEWTATVMKVRESLTDEDVKLPRWDRLGRIETIASRFIKTDDQSLLVLLGDNWKLFYQTIIVGKVGSTTLREEILKVVTFAIVEEIEDILEREDV